jgi:hypothetical protein
VLVGRAEPPAAGTGFPEPAHAALDLQGQQPAPDIFPVPDLGMGVDAVILRGLRAEQPPQLVFDRQLSVGHRGTGDLRRRLAAHHRHTLSTATAQVVCFCLIRRPDRGYP